MNTARAAIGANVAILGFYALIEAADLLLEQLGDFDLGILTTPEFNYGVPLLIMLVAAFSVFSSPDRRARRDRVKAG